MAEFNYDIDDVFSGGGAPAFKFETVGDSVTGTIIEMEARQQKDFDSGEAKTWSDGKPMMEIVITLQTSLRDKNVEDDDGTRRVFARGAMLTALKQAVRKAKLKKPEIGSTVTITHSGLGDAKKKGFNAPKLYEVQYTPAAESAVENVLALDDEVEVDDMKAKLANMTPEQIAAVLAAK